jgi:hypothetical protein
VSFAKSVRPPRPKRFGLSRVPLAALVRLLVFALLAIAGAGWALVYHYSHALPPMRVAVPTPPSAPTYDADAGEIPVPETLGQDGT